MTQESTEKDPTCPVCRDPYGGQHLSVGHTWGPGCTRWERLMESIEQAQVFPPGGSDA